MKKTTRMVFGVPTHAESQAASRLWRKGRRPAIIITLKPVPNCLKEIKRLAKKLGLAVPKRRPQ